MVRKSPSKHKVKQHTRKKRTVRSYSRGKGNKSPSRLVIRRRITTKEKGDAGWFKERRKYLIKEAKDSYDFFRKHAEYGEDHKVTEGVRNNYDMTKSLRVVPYPHFTGRCLKSAHIFSVRNKVFVGVMKGEKDVGYMCPYDGSGIITKEQEKGYAKSLEKFSKRAGELAKKLKDEKACPECADALSKFGKMRPKSKPDYKVLNPEKNPLLDYAEVKVDMSCQKGHFYMQGSGCFKVISSGKLICLKCGKPLFKSQKG